jgi:hypothetical protein
MSLDTSARPHELLQVPLKDIEIRKDANGRLVAPLTLGRYGKKQKNRTVGIFDSVKYYRAWRQQHPAPNNPDSFLFISTEHSQNIAMFLYQLHP